MDSVLNAVTEVTRHASKSFEGVQNSVINSMSSFSSLAGSPTRGGDEVHTKKLRIQAGFRRVLDTIERLEREGLIELEAGENESINIPAGACERILEATYGGCEGEEGAARQDVLGVAQSLAEGQTLNVTNSTMGCDPMPGKRKVFRVLYKPSTKTVTVTIPEGQNFRWPADAFESLVSATYGCDNVQVDVMNALQAAIFDAKGKPIPVSNDAFGGDPMPGVVKMLTVSSLPCRGRVTVKLPTDRELATFEAIACSLFYDLGNGIGLPMAELLTSLTSEELSGGEKQVSGKSGEIFWFSADKRFVLKTISDGEVATLVKMLPEYTTYLANNKDSLLTRYLGAFRLSDNGVVTQVVVMNNIFEGAPHLDAMYDLKGTTEDRWVDPAPGRCLKDNNFAEVTVYFDDDVSGTLHKAIREDTRFLERQGIMDYSMMCAMAYDSSGFSPIRRYSSLIGGLNVRESQGVLNPTTKECVVFIGLVDMLITYGWKKVAAHVLKINTIGWKEEIDTVAPPCYATRFRANFAKKFLGKSDALVVTEVPPTLFKTPMPALGRSGGTAAFFKVTYKDDVPLPPEHQSRDYWIGKDLARARDEVDFYEKAKLMQRSGRQPGWDVLDFMTPYMGVTQAPCCVKEGEPPETLEVMLLRNCRDGYKACRMLDIKMGQVTAVAGWQNKSAWQAWLQVNTIDNITNSEREGFRLEGFDGPPHSLLSIEDMLSSSVATKVAISDKKLKRLNLQRFTAAQFLTYFLDLHDASASSYAKRVALKPPAAPPSSAEVLSDAETQELVLMSCIEQLAGLLKACREVPVPQQWIGSSVMLAFDSESRPSREVLKRDASWGVARVHIFDWGRSELNTPALNDRLEEDVRDERRKHWGFYCGGMAMLLHECIRVYMLRFWHVKRTLFLTVWDKDEYTADDFIGRRALPFSPLEKDKQNLEDFGGSSVGGGFFRGTKARIEVSLKPRPLPADSRLQDCWSVCLHHAESLPSKDVQTDNDVFVEIAGVDVEPSALSDLSSVAKQQQLREGVQTTTTAVDQKRPVWEEEFEVATITDAARSNLVKAVAVALGMEGESAQAVEAVMAEFFPTKLAEALDDKEAAALQARFIEKAFSGSSAASVSHARSMLGA